jgi:hypothetical protein
MIEPFFAGDFVGKYAECCSINSINQFRVEPLCDAHVNQLTASFHP